MQGLGIDVQVCGDIPNVWQLACPIAQVHGTVRASGPAGIEQWTQIASVFYKIRSMKEVYFIIQCNLSRLMSLPWFQDFHLTSLQELQAGVKKPFDSVSKIKSYPTVIVLTSNIR